MITHFFASKNIMARPLNSNPKLACIKADPTLRPSIFKTVGYTHFKMVISTNMIMHFISVNAAITTFAY